ncbi:sigma factor-like helix-turn-helix DNA-binding protein [Terrisporobacter vanillatitrophus]|uniref:sigma factor-like helix-turn-helix DNA-binding protein n=1 Tax=Terrisporobacter vanillatitrophus TaxID=3058402 RepID=UPI00324229EC
MNRLGELVKLYKNGEKDALVEIVDIFRPIINKYKRNSYCEDMDNELIVFMITVLEKMPVRNDLLDNEKYLFSYIFKSLKNKYMRINQKSYLRYKNELLNYDVLGYYGHESLQSDVEFQDIIKDLSNREKDILNKKYLYNLNESDIARELNTSRQYINKVHKNALNKLKVLYN